MITVIVPEWAVWWVLILLWTSLIIKCLSFYFERKKERLINELNELIAVPKEGKK